MPSVNAKPDLYTLMNAYAVLEVPYTATSGDIRRAFRHLAALRHPDKLPSGSLDYRRATECMIELNAAHDLIRDAPLRHHRISQGGDPEGPWTDRDLEDAIRRGHAARRIEEVMSGALYVAFGGFSALMLLGRLFSQAAHPTAFIALAMLLCTLGALMGRRSLRLRYVLDQIFFLLRLVLR